MMNTQNKEVFKVTIDSKEKELCVRRPGPAEGRKAQTHYNQTFAAALQSGGLLRARVDGYMREQGLWDDKKEAQQRDLMKKLSDLELRIKQGGIKLTEAKKLALQMRELRGKFRELLSQRNSLDVNTVEGQAENARFNALVSLCLVYNDSGEPVYKSVDDYLEHAGDDAAFTGAVKLGQLLFRLDKDYEANLPENQFLKRFHFVDGDLRLINKDGKLVDEDGRLIDEEGRFINAAGEYVDRDGRRVDDDGNLVISEEEVKPFLDDDGNPIVEATEPPPPVEPASAPAAPVAEA